MGEGGEGAEGGRREGLVVDVAVGEVEVFEPAEPFEC